MGGYIPWLAPSEVGLVMGDSNPEVLDVLPPQVYLPFESLLSGRVRLLSASLSEVVQLSSDLSTAPMELS